ncbi:hypothetical protein MMYC01_200928 [Madurella mycetomatis]|uniref:Uncharacterized protein n=1 Tax=Madurella mycetomatis TaxID=100816 RepID=A0A175WEH1_9PEZI|nr:hypothetical protein MMYC01_200928 [Madurella mycetomatis]
MASNVSRTQASASALPLETAGAKPLFHYTLPPPPPEEVEWYSKKPLPPVPNRKQPLVSTLGKEMNEALATPDAISFSYRHPEPSLADWEKGAAGVAVNLGKQPPRSPREKPKPRKVNLPSTLPDQAIPPQPSSLVQKAQQATSRSHIPARREVCATLHRPDERIHSVIGGPGAIDPQVIRQQAQIRAAKREQCYEADDTSSTSPVSITSSTYNQGQGVAVSELDSVCADVDGRGYSPGSGSGSGSNLPSLIHAKNSSTPSSSISVPLHIVKYPKYDRSSGKKTTPPGCDELSPWFGGHPSPRDKYGMDPYHQVQVQLAWDDRQAARESPSTGTVAPGRLHSRDPAYHTRYDILPSSSNDRPSQPWCTEGDTAGPVGSGTFGRPCKPRHPPCSSASSSPERGALRTKPEYDSDNIDSSSLAALGTLDTDSFIPSNKNTATIPTIPGRHRTCLINLSPAKAKAFFHRSGITSNTPATPTTTPSSVKATSHLFPYPTRSESASAPASYASSHSFASSTTTAAKPNGSVVKRSMSALADLVSLLNRCVMSTSISGDEKRRQKLKSSIRVLADGGQVFSRPDASACASPSGSGVESGSALGLARARE